LKLQFYKIIKMLKCCRFYNKIKTNKIFSALQPLVQSLCLWLHIQSLCWCYNCAVLACTVVIYTFIILIVRWLVIIKKLKVGYILELQESKQASKDFKSTFKNSGGWNL